MLFLEKIKYLLKDVKLNEIFLKLTKYLVVKYKRRIREKKILSKNRNKEIFKEIYKTNFWKGDESKSGPGSSLKNTENIRIEIPKLIEKYKIKTILDLPCGDFHWFKKIINDLKINYLGGDIIDELIEINNKKYKNQYINFINIDIINDSLPSTDLLICRDCIFHFSYNDINRLFTNLKKSNIKFILITTHDFENLKLNNKDILTGSFRFIDLFKYPFSFEKNFEEKIFDSEYPRGYANKMMYLFKMENFVKNILRYQSKSEKIFKGHQ